MPLPSWLANRGLRRVPLLERLADKFLKKEEVQTIWGHQMKLDPQDSMNLSRWGFYEKAESEKVQQLIREGDIVLDVGANIGYYSILFASLVGKAGWVYAFEPHPENYATLVLNTTLNEYEDRIIAKNMACSSLAGWMYLYLSPISSGMHTVDPMMLARPTYKTKSMLEVRTGKLDDEALVDPVDFMKVDVEGHELEVLKGALQILMRDRPKLMVEYSASPKVIPYLEALDYEIEKLNEKNLFAYPPGTNH